MIPTHFDHPENAKYPDDEGSRPARQVWTALAVIVGLVLVLVVVLAAVTQDPASAPGDPVQTQVSE